MIEKYLFETFLYFDKPDEGCGYMYGLVSGEGTFDYAAIESVGDGYGTGWQGRIGGYGDANGNGIGGDRRRQFAII